MKAYLITTAIIFALILVAHVLRMMAEGSHLARDPWFLLTSVLTLGMLLWAVRLLWRSSRS